MDSASPPQRSKIVNMLQMTHATNFKTTPRSEIDDTINCFQTGLLLNNCFVRALCKEERPRETHRQSLKERKDWGVVVKTLVANSHSTKVGSRNTRKRTPSLHLLCGILTRWKQLSTSACATCKCISGGSSSLAKPSPEQSRTHNDALHSILFQNTKHSALVLRVQRQSHRTQ